LSTEEKSKILVAECGKCLDAVTRVGDDIGPGTKIGCLGQIYRCAF
jgi:hypothetical protein